ncbi:hypothetical protein T439DRAFT_336471 [Meredithblackwellia eburnea MCA 4105]
MSGDTAGKHPAYQHFPPGVSSLEDLNKRIDRVLNLDDLYNSDSDCSSSGSEAEGPPEFVPRQRERLLPVTVKHPSGSSQEVKIRTRNTSVDPKILQQEFDKQARGLVPLVQIKTKLGQLREVLRELKAIRHEGGVIDSNTPASKTLVRCGILKKDGEGKPFSQQFIDALIDRVAKEEEQAKQQWQRVSLLSPEWLQAGTNARREAEWIVKNEE